MQASNNRAATNQQGDIFYAIVNIADWLLLCCLIAASSLN